MIAATIGATALAPCLAFAQSADVPANSEDVVGWQFAPVNAIGAYALGYTGRGVQVGVLDSGLDVGHPEFEGRVLEGYDFTNDFAIDTEDNYDLDTHGTHVSGIIAAARDGKGMHGIAYNAEIRPAIINTATTDQDAIFADGWRFLADSGVSIINNSLGVNDCSESISPPCNVTDYSEGFFEQNRPDTIAAMKYTAEKGVLMVFATGNEAQPAPDALGGMPYWIPELRDNWLVVGAVDAEGNLADFSNKCSVAAEWCLVAPGVDIYSTVPRGEGGELDPDYDFMSGTSMATPVVTGVAALVKEAFPFFTAKDLQQTLLTTATNLGDAEKYGWGMVNAGKAVKGYGKFVSDVTIDTQGYDATFANDIDGEGSLTKVGDGSLSLTGDNSYEGGTLVQGGSVSIDGTVTSLVYVDDEGTLRGTGTIEAPLSVAGRLAPGNSPGTLTVGGPVELQDSAVSAFDIDGTGTGNGRGNYARLVTTGGNGVIEVGGALMLRLRGITGDATNTFVASLGTNFNIIHSSVEVIGSFETLTQPGAGLERATRFDTIYDRTNVSLVVTPEAYGNLAANDIVTTANETAVGTALDAVRPDAGARAGALFNGLYATGNIANALGQLSGEIHAAASTLQVARATALQDAIGERLRSSSAAGAVDENATFWTSAYGGWGSADGGRTETFDWDMANVLFGMDTPVGDTARIGIAAGTGRTNGDIDTLNARVKGNHYDIVAYGAAAFGAFETSLGASHSWSDLSTRRSPDFGGFRERLSDSYDTRTAQVFGELGYRATAGAFELNPFVAASYMAISGSVFDETGGSSALSGRVASRDLGVTVTGLRVSTDVDLGGGVLSTNAMLGWQHLYGSTQGTADVSFAGGTPFSIEGAGLARDALRVDLGADYAINDRAKVGLGYRGTLAGSSHSSSVRGDLKVAF